MPNSLHNIMYNTITSMAGLSFICNTFLLKYFEKIILNTKLCVVREHLFDKECYTCSLQQDLIYQSGPMIYVNNMVP